MKKLGDYLNQKDGRSLQILGFIILSIAAGFAFFNSGDELMIAKSLGVGSIGLATISIGMAIDSGNKMKAIANSNFIEKHAMIHGYIDALNHREYGFLDRCKTDLKSSLELKDWVSNKKKEELIDAVIELIKIALEDKKELESFLEILDVSMKFNIKIKELKILKKQLKEINDLKIGR